MIRQREHEALLRPRSVQVVKRKHGVEPQPDPSTVEVGQQNVYVPR
jgi:hypothetical protein